MTKKSVIDINSGLGGRAYAFFKAGYKIEALIEGDKENSNILKAVFKNVLIIDDAFNDIDVSRLPDVGIISAKYYPQPFSIASKTRIRREYSVNELIINIIKYKMPNFFILEVPVSYIGSRKEILENDLQMYRELGYKFSYSVIEEKKFSGYPVHGRQAFFIGTINGDDDEFEYLFQKPEVPNKELVMEDAEEIDLWYRIIRFNYENWEQGKHYVREKENITLSDQINNGFMRENYFVDELGPRKITHNELAKIKGLFPWNFNDCKNKRRLYQKLAYETNVFVIYEIAQKISKYFEQPILNCEKGAVELVNRKKTNNRKTKGDKAPIVFPILFIK